MASKNKRTEYLATRGKPPVSITHPHLLEEWGFDKNEIRPEEITYGSHKKIRWVCSKDSCKYGWVANIKNRALNGQGCPACANRVVTDKNSLAARFPLLVGEVADGTDPNRIVYSSTKKIKWRCGVCGHEWRARVLKRTKRHQGCPACAGRAVTENNSLLSCRPDVVLEWSYDKNGDLCPSDFTEFSGKVIWWECRVCNYAWKAPIVDRTGSGANGCPACAGKVVTDKNRLSVLYPGLCKEWHPTRNMGLKPQDISFGSHVRVWWKCSNGKCQHEWNTAAHIRTNLGRGCPRCSGSSISKISQQWLDSLNIPDLKREHYIKDLKLKVDGYDPETEGVYEFLGDFWHGNPEIYERDALNTKVNKTFGELYDLTFERIKSLEEAGYKVVYIWENDFRLKGEDL